MHELEEERLRKKIRKKIILKLIRMDEKQKKEVYDFIKERKEKDE